ncbi:cytochrome c5 family protein [Paraglaciecola sp. MB-3u-78]|uniref:c-type cytochrome n=1 Tax=Paraglaciecola sp. MB-3u-78 TaxID=2058332 RepID=UPI000C34158A|nr:c-type cytochrome [Paraglaciecola sp. MB-3u-78]PKG97841.1 cytochrome c5 family protein [Paraglaciecola sp. MB-3u-78]
MKFKVLLCICMGVFSVLAVQAQEMSEADIKARIQPVGKVHVAGAKDEVASTGPRTGSEVYAKACVACHSVGVLNAPKFQDAADWAPRMEQGFDTVWKNAINGIRAMPPMGTCGDCSNDEIKAAIEHMIEGI